MNAVLIVTGLLILTLGAELLVRGAASLAFRLGLPPILIGLTVVAYGTSAPELAVSAKGALSGTASLALGNVVGSNIFNILAVLGLSALILPLRVSRRLIRFDVPIMAVLSGLVWWLCAGDGVTRPEAALLTGLLVVYTTGLFILTNRAPRMNPIEQECETAAILQGTGVSVPRAIGASLLGLGLLAVGSQALVAGATAVARGWGISEAVVGLTLVAAGTSLPELATSVVATIRGERDIAIGNAVGSCIFNLLGVLGISALLAPGGLDVPSDMLAFDLPVMVAVAIACLPVFVTGGTLSRSEAAAFLGYYGLYLALLIHQARGGALPLQPLLLILISVLPAIVLAVIWSLVRSQRQVRIFVEGLNQEVATLFTDPLRQTKRLITLVVGSTVVMFGGVLLITPGPGVVVVLVGIGILATEFVWARRLLKRLQQEARDAAGRITGRGGEPTSASDQEGETEKNTGRTQR